MPGINGKNLGKKMATNRIRTPTTTNSDPPSWAFTMRSLLVTGRTPGDHITRNGNHRLDLGVTAYSNLSGCPLDEPGTRLRP